MEKILCHMTVQCQLVSGSFCSVLSSFHISLPQDDEVENFHHPDHTRLHWVEFIQIVDDQEPKLQYHLLGLVFGVPTHKVPLEGWALPEPPTWAWPRPPCLLPPLVVAHIFPKLTLICIGNCVIVIHVIYAERTPSCPKVQVRMRESYFEIFKGKCYQIYHNNSNAFFLDARPQQLLFTGPCLHTFHWFSTGLVKARHFT